MSEFILFFNRKQTLKKMIKIKQKTPHIYLCFFFAFSYVALCLFSSTTSYPQNSPEIFSSHLGFGNFFLFIFFSFLPFVFRVFFFLCASVDSLKNIEIHISFLLSCNFFFLVFYAVAQHSACVRCGNIY